MNPQGKWVMRNLELQFISEEIMAIYGKVYPILKDKTTMWYWEARTGMENRINVSAPPPCGYAYNKEDACSIVEHLLYLTKTVTPIKQDF
jgi:hypothetical protein